MNKFLNSKYVKPSKKSTVIPRENGKAYDIIQECAACWSSLETVRKKMRRSVMYAYEDQWGDMIKDPETGFMITENELIRKQGKQPLKNNMISPILKNVDGQFRNNITETICSVRDQEEAKIGEMMSIALEYVQELNETVELDSDTLRMLLLGGFSAQRIEYGWNPNKRMNDVWVFGVNPSRMFFNTDMEDVRGWDLNLIGEIYDMRIENIIAAFARSKEDEDWIHSIYGRKNTSVFTEVDGMQGNQNKDMTFFVPSRSDMCRVIFAWKLETRPAIYCHDYLKGTFYYADKNKMPFIDAENKRRIQKAKENGVLPEDTLLIEYEYANELYWYYRYMTPAGDILQEGRSPYWHEQHNYALMIYPMIQGHIFNFVEDFIDQQRAINRTMMLIDFMRSSSAKGVLIVDESVCESMTKEDLVDEYVRYNGVIFVKLREGKNIDNVIKQYNGGASLAGDFELLNLQLKLINDIAGVNSAMQGKEAPSGTAASLYAQQVQQSSLNLKGLFESFKSFRKRRDYKLMQTIQQYYTSARHIDISGKFYSKESRYYNPEKVQNAEIDIQLTDGTNTPVFQALENEFLEKLYQQGAIDIKIMLENCSYPFASKILESIKQNEQAMQQSQQIQGVDPNMMQQVTGASNNPQMMQKLQNDKNASPMDGIVQRAA